MFITDADLLSALASELHRAGIALDGSDLEAFWTPIVSRSNTAAYWEIIHALMGRGFDKETQIDLWDRGAEFQTAIGIWWCLEHGAAIDSDSYRAEALNELKLDRRKEL